MAFYMFEVVMFGFAISEAIFLEAVNKSLERNDVGYAIAHTYRFSPNSILFEQRDAFVEFDFRR